MLNNAASALDFTRLSRTDLLDRNHASRITAPDFDLAKTLNSGQVFHWEKYGRRICRHDWRQGGLRGAARRRVCSFSGAQDAKSIANYFALDHPLEEICRSFPRDPAMNAARDFCRGLRIIRQPKWECLATFISSSMKQVAHIRQISRALRTRFGERKDNRRELSFTLFRARRGWRERVENELRACALGYRAKNLLATARLVASGEANSKNGRRLPDDELRARLCELPGVGAKVANCVMLFAYERLARVSDRCLDRARSARKIFSAKAKADRDASCANLRKTISANTAATRSSICFITRARRRAEAPRVAPRREDTTARALQHLSAR